MACQNAFTAVIGIHEAVHVTCSEQYRKSMYAKMPALLGNIHNCAAIQYMRMSTLHVVNSTKPK